MDKNIVALISAMIDVKNEKSLDSVTNRLYEELNQIDVKVFREDRDTILPSYSKNGDACMDIYAKSIEYDKKYDRYIIHTGLYFELPDNYEMEIRPRSSNTKTDLYMPNSPCTIDSGYRGEVLIVFKTRTNIDLYDTSHISFPYQIGDRIAQLLVRRREVINWNEVDSLNELSTTDRGISGFGSTGK